MRRTSSRLHQPVEGLDATGYPAPKVATLGSSVATMATVLRAVEVARRAQAAPLGRHPTVHPRLVVKDSVATELAVALSTKVAEAVAAAEWVAEAVVATTSRPVVEAALPGISTRPTTW